MTRIVRLSIVAIALTFCTATPALAQAPPPAVNWTGFYVGGHVGAGFRTGFGFEAVDYGNYNAQFDVIDGPVSGGMSFGAQAGINHVFGKRFVAGGEFAIGKLGYSGTGESALFGGDTSATTRGGTYWTGLGRAGYAFGNAVPYFTMGVVATSHEVEILDDCTTPPCGAGTVSATGSDLSDIEIIWGVGLEYALKMKAMNKRWTVKVEWLNSDFRVASVARQPNAQPFSGFTWGFTTHFPQSVIRGMINVYLK